MALSPLDIKNKTFTTKLRGFSVDEVEEFIDQVVGDYEDVIRQKRELEKSLRHAEEKLSYFNELKDALNQSIIVAQDTADKLKDSAAKESDVIISRAENLANEVLNKANEDAKSTVNQARQLSSQILNDATEKVQKLASETDDLKKKTRSFYRNLTMLLEEQVAQLQSDEWEEILKPFDTFLTDYHEMVKEVLVEKEVPQVDFSDEFSASSDSSDSEPKNSSETDKIAELDEKFSAVDIDKDLRETLAAIEAANLLEKQSNTEISKKKFENEDEETKK